VPEVTLLSDREIHPPLESERARLGQDWRLSRWTSSFGDVAGCCGDATPVKSCIFLARGAWADTRPRLFNGFLCSSRGTVAPGGTEEGVTLSNKEVHPIQLDGWIQGDSAQLEERRP